MYKQLKIIGNEEETLKFCNALPNIASMLLNDEFMYDGNQVLVDTTSENSEMRLVKILNHFMKSVSVYDDKIVVIPV